MARRRESVFDTLLVLPWWVAVGLGLFGYAASAFLLPLIWTGPILAPAAKGFAPLGLLWLGLCAIAASGSALRSFLVSRKFDRQCGLGDIRSLSWRQFESIVGEAFRRRGYSVVENAIDGADGGIDLALRKDGKMIQGLQNAEPHLMQTSGGFRATTTWSNGTDVPKCPSCGSEMVGRTAKRGANAGSKFWGCSQYPRCRGTRAV